MASESKPRVGFAGLGAMGSRMAKRVHAAGYPLVVWNRSPAATDPFRAMGVPVAASPAELAASADVVVSMLLNDAAVTDVLDGPKGVIAAARPGATLVEMSTIAPATARRLHGVAAARGLSYLDAPVSGSTPQAEAGELVVLVGGDGPTFDRCKPLLLAMGKAAEHLGGPGAGATAKLSVNAILAVGMQGLAEALALGERAGLDRHRLIAAVGQTAVISPGQRAKLPNAESDHYPPAFALQTLAKDLGLMLALAAKVCLPVPALAATRAAAAGALEAHGREDLSVLFQVAREGRTDSNAK